MPTSVRVPDDDVLPELVRLMFTSLKAVLTVGIAMAAVAGTIWVAEGDRVAGVFLVVALASLAVRVAVTLRYGRADHGEGVEEVAEARRWERRYALAGAAFAFSLGLFGAYAILALDVVSLALVLTVLLGYPCGMVVRVAVRPWIAKLLLLVVFLPPIAGSLVRATPEALLLAGLMAAYLASTFEMVGYLHATIGDRIRLSNDLSRLAMHDDLTGLPNRRYFAVRLDEANGRWARYRTSFAFHAVDLDHFKRVNDTMGHAAGDEVLRQVAGRLRGLLRSTDIVARLGGDEFAVLQTPVASPREVEALAGRIVEELARPFAVDGREAGIGASVGICGPDEGTHGLDRIKELADAALYRSKEAGRGRFAVAGVGMVEPADA